MSLSVEGTREADRRRGARYYARNREKVAAMRKAWRAANPERVRANSLAYYERNKAICAQRSMDCERKRFARDPDAKWRKRAITILGQQTGLRASEIDPDLISAKAALLKVKDACKKASRGQA